MSMRKCNAVAIMGTRPEGIKIAPVISALRERSDEINTIVISTAQHRQMLDQVLSLFQITPDIDLNVMQPDQTLSNLTAQVIEVIEVTLQKLHPDLLLVQGDTTTAFASSLAAFYRKVPIAHIEAGLRSYDIYNPFPEEANRKLTSVLADIHFAPTSLAAKNLIKEAVPRSKIVITGNTVVDSLKIFLNTPFNIDSSPLAKIPFDNYRVMLVTSHRRESWGEELKNICLALRDLTDRFHDLLVVYPVHMNPNVRKVVMSSLEGVERVHLIEPIDYLTFINLMQRSYIILTDSGGIQEEAPSLNKPLFVLRKLTERPEAFDRGLAKVIGTSTVDIVTSATELLSNFEAYKKMSQGDNPYGDGLASTRIAEAICRWWRGAHPLLESAQEFSTTRPGINYESINHWPESTT
ncbi:non-hydrolyzing UDP-N-acetylglucosamine 2-epimerase [Nitrosococcus watsonii]|uniref:UDP-N-acetylglucosamine 2-epimerase (non-hydrolyzing) n=1 Tax=Nitrosococcus watsoni (strain C-113) TaxID=105559 RepID=D8KBD9_NITWC|nr:UDP-N-acetylglucosamine 2-epimerase (non-hydrolyzing) [Nitrosococcus watsonii]ADJ29586.1 UDP-N-acetylglucosamine 2-epimerase [Nitrosococcus watsonii C-113]